MTDYRLPLMAGIDIPIPEIRLTVHVPKIKDIAYMGEERFFKAIQYICLEKETLIQDEFLLQSLTNFQVLMKVLSQSQDKTKREDLATLLKLLFPNYVTIFTDKAIILTIPNQSEIQPVLIDDSNFGIFQNVLKEVLCVHSIFQGKNIVYNPVNKRAQEIANKIMRGREKIAELKSQGKKESVLTRYISVLTMGVPGLTLEDCLNLNLFQLFDLMERYSAYAEWDISIRVQLAGGTLNKPIEPWMRDLHP